MTLEEERVKNGRIGETANGRTGDVASVGAVGRVVNLYARNLLHHWELCEVPRIASVPISEFAVLPICSSSLLPVSTRRDTLSPPIFSTFLGSPIRPFAVSPFRSEAAHLSTPAKASAMASPNKRHPFAVRWHGSLKNSGLCGTIDA